MGLILQVATIQLLKQVITDERAKEIVDIITKNDYSFEELFNSNGINPLLGITSSEWINLKKAISVTEQHIDTLDLNDCIPWFKSHILNAQQGQPVLYLQSDLKKANLTIIQTFLIDNTINIGLAPLNVIYTNHLSNELQQSFNNQKLLLLT